MISSGINVATENTTGLMQNSSVVVSERLYGSVEDIMTLMTVMITSSPAMVKKMIDYLLYFFACSFFAASGMLPW